MKEKLRGFSYGQMDICDCRVATQKSLNSWSFPYVGWLLCIIRLCIVILDAPVCDHQKKEVFGAARQELVSIPCQVTANPTDNLKFEWIFSKGDEKLDMQQSQIR